MSKKCAFFASLWNFSEFLRVFAFSPLIFSQFGHLAQKLPLPIYAICPNLTRIRRVFIEKSPCKFSISPISTGLKLGISPETHLQIPVLSLIGARHFAPCRPSPISSSYLPKNAYFLLFSPVLGCAIIENTVDIRLAKMAFTLVKSVHYFC